MAESNVVTKSPCSPYSQYRQSCLDNGYDPETIQRRRLSATPDGTEWLPHTLDRVLGYLSGDPRYPSLPKRIRETIAIKARDGTDESGKWRPGSKDAKEFIKKLKSYGDWLVADEKWIAPTLPQDLDEAKQSGSEFEVALAANTTTETSTSTTPSPCFTTGRKNVTIAGSSSSSCSTSKSRTRSIRQEPHPELPSPPWPLMTGRRTRNSLAVVFGSSLAGSPGLGTAGELSIQN